MDVCPVICVNDLTTFHDNFVCGGGGGGELHPVH